jgi:hypothetical protein
VRDNKTDDPVARVIIRRLDLQQAAAELRE